MDIGFTKTCLMVGCPLSCYSGLPEFFWQLIGMQPASKKYEDFRHVRKCVDENTESGIGFSSEAGFSVWICWERNLFHWIFCQNNEAQSLV